MTTPTRRDLVRTGIGLAAMGAIPALAGATPPRGATRGGLATGRAQPLKLGEIKGFLSAKQLTEHHRVHYGGALKGYLTADARLEAGARGDRLDGAAFAALSRARTSKANSVMLHELYFGALAAKAGSPPRELAAVLSRRFGSVDRWAADLAACAATAAGWALLVRHRGTGKLYNLVCDEHATGPMWMTTPLVALDVYEHAFYLDYASRKGEYVERFLEHLDWAVVARRARTQS